MPAWLRWTLALGIAVLITVVPFMYYRSVYDYGKRLRTVDPVRGVYRSGQMTAEGFADTIQRYHIRTVVNLQDEYPDPDIDKSYLSSVTVKESELCRRLGANYVYMPPDLIRRRQLPAHRPLAIDRALVLFDDPANYPILLHCRAGLHRTGVMVALYRMEYQGWSPSEAIAEMKGNGFGEWPCTAANDYIAEYVLAYQRGLRRREAIEPTADNSAPLPGAEEAGASKQEIADPGR